MRRTRTQRAGTWLAILALVLLTAAQVVHGHVHALGRIHVAHVGACAAAGAGSADTSCPDEDRESADCPICWAVAVAGHGVVPVQPAIARPVWLPAVAPAGLIAPTVREAAAAAYDARAPPRFQDL